MCLAPRGILNRAQSYLIITNFSEAQFLKEQEFRHIPGLIVVLSGGKVMLVDG